jgi:hypothetical protein
MAARFGAAFTALQITRCGSSPTAVRQTGSTSLLPFFPSSRLTNCSPCRERRPDANVGDLMPVSVSCPQLLDATARERLHKAVESAIRRWRPGFEQWQLSVFRSQTGDGWELAIRGPRFRKVLTLHGPQEDLPGLVTAYVDAVLANA